MEEKNRIELLNMYQNLRVADVNDGMDAVGLMNMGCVERSIRPLWRDSENFSHRICGFARTVRFRPVNETIHAGSVEEYDRLKKQWYARTGAGAQNWVPLIEDGDIIVIEGSGLKDVGFIGSANAQGWINRGARGVVTNGGCRDSDELIKQAIPVYSAYIGRGIKPGRCMYDDSNIPLNIGGVLVRPGDIVVADGDGVVVVPIQRAKDVALYACGVHEEDKSVRRKLYEAADMEPDFTVQ